MSASDEVRAVAEALAAPFDPGEVKFKPQTVSGNRALAIPYVDARVVMDRLDDVLGIDGWQDAYDLLDGGEVQCRLSCHLGGEWIVKADVGGESEQPDEGDRRKASYSDALKRAAVKFGIARYLYRQKPQWVDYDPQKKQFVRPPTLPGTATAPDGCRPAPSARPTEAEDRVSAQQVAALADLIHDTGANLPAWCAHYGVRSIPDLPASRFDEAVKLLNQKKAKAG